jgi:hypothetical protein
MMLGKYSFGIGDRFGHQGKAQAAALMKAREQGLDITPVWNKSNREHSIIGTKPADVRREADAAVAACGWEGPYFVDADHIGLATVDAFLDASDFFTLDVADFIGRPAPEVEVKAFLKEHRYLLGSHHIEGIDEAILLDEPRLASRAGKYLTAVRQAGAIYRHIATAKGPDTFITEVSIDETDTPQTPTDMLVILAALADEGIPLQTIAPKFSGRFNKGVDYVGDVRQFATEFEQDLAVLRFAVGAFDLPANLKLSVHSGSDKFSIYAPIRAALQKFDAGLHLKTAGTTWLEELIGLALAGDDGLSLAKGIYAQAVRRQEELCGPYATVIDIDTAKLPDLREVQKWDGACFAATLRHDPSCPQYNLHFRQLLHVAYRLAAELGPCFTEALEKHETVIAAQVTTNLYDRHIRPVFRPDAAP